MVLLLTKHRKYYLLLLAFLLGFIVMAFEVYSLKKAFLFFPENTYTVSIALSSFLTGLGFSSLICARLVNQHQRLIDLVLLLLFFCFSVYGLFIIDYAQILTLTFKLLEISGYFAFIKGSILWIYLFIPALLIGGAFPLLISKNHDLNNPYSSVGTIYFFDILGGAIGAIITGVLLLPNFGLNYIMILICCLGLLSMFLIQKRHILNFILMLFIGFFLFINSSYYPRNKEVTGFIPASQTARRISFIASPPKNKGKLIPYRSEFGDVIFQEASPYGVVTVGISKSKELGDSQKLWINHRCMCASSYYISEHQLGFLTISNLTGNSNNVLNIGLGCGFTAGAIMKEHEKVNQLTIMEINPAVIKACTENFSQYNDSIVYHPKVDLLLKDGTAFIRQNKTETFDAIIVDIEEPGVIQSSPIYTVEYAKMIKAQLNPEGIFALWAIYGGDEYNNILFNTLSTVFPYVVFQEHNGNPQLYASERPLNIENQAPEEWFRESNETKIINTIDNRALEKSYSIEEVFMLPDNFTDPQIRKIDG